MADSVDQIIDNIPIIIQTGIPANVKSYNHRPLMLEVAKHLVRGRENAEHGKYYVIRGVNDPDNPGEVMFVMTQMSSQRQISVYDEYSDLPGPLEGTILDQFFYVAETQTIYTRRVDNSYQQLGYLKKLNFISAEPGDVVNFPPSEGNDVWVVRIENDKGVPQPNAGIWLGGYSGVFVGHESMVFAKVQSPGGTFADVGQDYTIINQRRQTVIEYYDHFIDFPSPGRPNVIYVEEDTMITYYWSPSIVDYVANGSAIYGELIDSTTFEDELGNPVTPGAANIYIDITDNNKAYNWDGNEFVPINNTTSGGGGEIDWSNLTDKKHLRYDSSLGKPVDSNTSDTPTGISVDGRTDTDLVIEKAVNATGITTAYAIDLGAGAGNFNLTLSGATDFSFSNMIVEAQSCVFTMIIDNPGENAFQFPIWLKEDPDSDEASTLDRVVIHIHKGGVSPDGTYHIKNL